jgi:hypothetical protein
VVPPSGFIKYDVRTPGIFRDGKAIGFGPNDVMVVVFKVPPADPAWQLTFVQTGDGALGPAATRTIVLSRKPCDFAYPTKSADAIWANEAPNLGLTLASGTTPSAYSRYLLVPGQELYVNIRNKTADGGGCFSTRCDISFATANNIRSALSASSQAPPLAGFFGPLPAMPNRFRSAGRSARGALAAVALIGATAPRAAGGDSRSSPNRPAGDSRSPITRPRWPSSLPRRARNLRPTARGWSSFSTAST